jgi:hypothetical protein
MKLFKMASGEGQHAIDQDCPKDMFGNMQAGLITVGSKNEKDIIHGYTRN